MGIVSTIITTLGISFLLLVGLLLLRGRSFKHVGVIAQRLGSNIDDITFIIDKFKVIKKDGYYTILWKTYGREPSPSPEFKLWARFFKKPITKDVNKWSRGQIKKLVVRGAFFYQTTEGELKPMTVQATGELKVLNQDNRAFIINSIRKNKEFRAKNKDKLIAAAMTVGVVFLLVMLTIVGLIFFNNYMAENIAAVCSGVQSNPQFLQQVQGIVGA